MYQTLYTIFCGFSVAGAFAVGILFYLSLSRSIKGLLTICTQTQENLVSVESKIVRANQEIYVLRAGLDRLRELRLHETGNQVIIHGEITSMAKESGEEPEGRVERERAQEL